MSEKHSFKLPENPEIVFEQNNDTKEVTMKVCNEPVATKRVPDFTLRTVRRHFGQEIREHKDEVCPTSVGDKEE